MRPLPLLAVSLLLAAAFGASPTVNSVERSPAASQVPHAQRSADLTALAERLRPSDPLRGIGPAQEAIALARTPAEKLAAEVVLADLLRLRTDYQAALDLARLGLAEAAALGDQALRGAFLCDLGRIEWNMADHVDALKHFDEAITVGEELGDPRVLIDAHLGAFIVWQEFGERAQARAELEAAAKYALPLDDPMRLADYYRGLGNERLSENDLAGARAAHERSRAISERAGQTRGVADGEINLSAIDEADGRLDEARNQAVEAIAVYERLGLKRYLANADRQLGTVLLKQGRYTEALDCQKRSLALAEALGGRAAIANSDRDLALTYEAEGNLPAALEYRRKLEGESSAIFSDKSRQQIALIQATFESERSRHQVELLRRDQEIREAELGAVRAQRYGLIAVVLLGACAAAAILSRARMKLSAERRVLVETRAARKAAEDANELKTRLLAIASHDLKSPLSGLIGCARQIEQNAGDAAGAADLASSMCEEGARMLSLVSNLLDVARIEGGRLEAVPARCDLAAIGVERARAHQRAAAAKGQVLTWELPPSGTAPVTGDAGRLAQVFDNLISNAVKFTPSGGPIHLSVATSGSRAIASVRDGGPGLQPEDLTRLFQPFQTLSAQPTGGESSSGLGLFIAQEIVALHGGRLGVESAPGQGATFTVELPLALGAGCSTAAVAL